ncbi:MAG: nucleotidyl transferase AbiEii/AbiGii toxin family protein [Ferrimicrobium sp.]
MKGLDNSQTLAIAALLARGEFPLSPVILEKDILVRDAILALADVGKPKGCELVFCGGTCLSQAHQVIRRMSEDVDFRVVVPSGLSNGQKRKLLSAVKHELVDALNEAGFPLVGEVESGNNNSYIAAQFGYYSQFSNTGSSLREHIKFELTTFTPLTPVSLMPLATILDRVTGSVSDDRQIATITIEDTLADKLVGYLRRTAQARAEHFSDRYDPRLVRHLYDVHEVLHALGNERREEVLDVLGSLVAQTIERDVATYANQWPVFADAPYSTLINELSHLGDPDVKERYDKFCQSMIWGDAPAFESVLTAFSTLAAAVLREHDGGEQL